MRAGLVSTDACNRVVVDDGVRATAWDLKVPAESWRLLPPGTFVHVRVNLHNREVAIDPAEPPGGGPLPGNPSVSVRPAVFILTLINVD
jgi:hypothetical protein